MPTFLYLNPSKTEIQFKLTLPNQTLTYAHFLLLFLQRELKYIILHDLDTERKEFPL